VVLLCLSWLLLAATAWAQPGGTDNSSSVAAGGPIRLRPVASPLPDRQAQAPSGADIRRSATSRDNEALDEFETYVSRLAGLGQSSPVVIRRFASELVTGGAFDDAEDAQPLVPPDYVISPGDELQILFWGSVDADLLLKVDRTGRISIPRVGAVMVAGVRYGELEDVIGKRARQVFRNYQLSVSLGRLRNVRVFVTGYVKRPGTYSVSALSTLVTAVMRAGGPAASGSFRDIQLRRAGSVPVKVDLYDLMLRGDKSADRSVQADDIIFVGPMGPQVALIGSVNKPAIFEIKPGETLADVLTMAGGHTSVADRSRLTMERLDDRQVSRVVQLAWPSEAQRVPENGDVFRAFSAVDTLLPVAQQNKRIRIEGEVHRSGDFVVPASTTLSGALKLAGGLTPQAYLFGTEFSRESVRVTQQANYERAVRDLETEFTKATGSQRLLDGQEAAAQAAQISATTRLIERLKSIKPSGRIVLQLAPDTRELPDLPLEDGDRIFVPALPSTVGVFGSVFSSGSYLIEPGRSVGDVLSLAGGPTRGADTNSVFVIRANGSVVSQPQRAGFLGLTGTVNHLAVLAGDTVFVPEEIYRTSWIQGLKEWSQILYQFGLGAAAFRTLRN
jgi:protein involved in polysaccharide export with SLBB domain